MITTPNIARYRNVGRRAGWGLADQAFSSLSNFALGVFVARSVSLREFGIFGLAFATYSLAMGLARACAGEPFGVRYSACSEDEWREGARGSMGAALIIGAFIGTVCTIVGLFFDGSTRGVLVALGVAMPFLIAQDGWRYIFFASGQGKQALLNDLVWTLIMVPAFAIVIWTSTDSATSFVVAWSSAATCAALFGCWQARLLPLPSRVLAWWRNQRDLIPGFLGDFGIRTGTQRASGFLVAVFAGLAATGALRGADMLLGPVTVLFMGVNAIAVPETARIIKRNVSRLPLSMVLLSAGLSTSAILVGLMLLMVPDSAGEALLKDTWQPAREVLPFLALALAVSAANTGAMIGMRALGDSVRMFRTRLVAAPLVALGVIAGAAIGGAVGAALGNAIATSFTNLVWWHQFKRAVAAYGQRVANGNLDPKERASKVGRPSESK